MYWWNSNLLRQMGKAKPVCFRVVQEPIKRIRGRIDIGIDSLLCMVVFGQLNYTKDTKGTASMPF